METMEYKLDEFTTRYRKVSKLGEGVSGVVYKYEDTKNQRFVAIKKKKPSMKQAGVPQEAYREILLLRSLKHKNLVTCYDIRTRKNKVYLIMEYLERPLHNIGNIRETFRQILQGLASLHKRGVMHRDVKTHNILLRDDFTPVLIDFGLSKRVSNTLTPTVCTIWYRAPELLMGATSYGQEIDIWAAGMVFAEMLLGFPLARGKNELHQLNLLVSLFGSSKASSLSFLPAYIELQSIERRDFSTIFPKVEQSALDLFLSMCAMDPASRFTVFECLTSAYFN